MTVKNNAAIEPHPETQPQTPGKWGWLAWLPIPLLLAAIAALWVADLRVVWSLPLLFWLVHYGSPALAVAFVVIPAARSFMVNRRLSILMLGCGVLISQIGATFATAGVAPELDTYFAVYNTSVFLSALCHLAGVTITSRLRIRLERPAMWLSVVYMGGTAAMALIIWAAGSGWMPVFFIEGQGGTLLRSLVVSMAVALFLLTAGLLWQTNRRAASPFFYWYALGLVLLAIGLAGSTLIVVRDSPLQWITRSTQVLGFVYMCVAVLASARESGVRTIPLAAVEEEWREDSFLSGFGKQTTMGWVLRYGLAVVVVAAAMGLRLAFQAWVGPGLPVFVTFYPAIMVAAMLAGFGPGLTATALAALIAGYWVLPPVGQLAIESPVDRLGLVIFIGMGIFISVVAKLYRSNRIKAAVYDSERALRESQARLRRFYESELLGIIYWNMNGAITDANDYFLKMAGYTRQELTAGSIDWIRMTPPEYRYLDEQSAADLKATGVNSTPFEKEYIRKDGTRVPVLVAAAMLDDARFNGVAFVLDISERKTAEHALHRSEERYRMLFNAQIDGFCIIKVIFDSGKVPIDYRFLECNPAFEEQTGLQKAEGKLMRELVPDHEEHWFELYGKVALTGEPASFENEAKALKRWFEGYAYRVDMPEDRHVAIIFNDITIRKQAEEKIQRHVEDLQAKNAELERANRVMIGRELRMIELKKEVNELCKRAGEPPRYKED